ncbi:MAG: primosomal protein N', partial [Lachnospiraceae bacterium]|nr:primosomal protein N' [Lachnospiraceae bacterium]
GMLEHAKVVLGSATPSLEAYYGARQGTYRLFTMSSRAAGGTLPAVHTVDLREELRAGNRSILSRFLRERMENCLAQHQQMMLFMNRRGYAGFVVCRACGHVMKCPHCDVSLSLHRNNRLICHYCGHQEAAVQKCPKCGSGYIGGFRAGTQQVEEIVAKEFPQARILRMDADTTRGKDGHAEILRAFSKKEADILIGTQMIVKGHDFPDVTLVGILAADLSLHVSDYRASERTFQLLTQAAGRAGRGTLAGEVVIQTYDPEHYAVTCAAAQEYVSFYEKEIACRSLSGYPPVGGLLGIHCTCSDRERLEMASGYLGRFARQIAGKYQVSVLGPVDEPVAKIQDIHRMVIYAKQSDSRRLTAFKNKLEDYIEINEGYKEIGIQFEMN